MVLTAMSGSFGGGPAGAYSSHHATRAGLVAQCHLVSVERHLIPVDLLLVSERQEREDHGDHGDQHDHQRRERLERAGVLIQPRWEAGTGSPVASGGEERAGQP